MSQSCHIPLIDTSVPNSDMVGTGATDAFVGDGPSCELLLRASVPLLAAFFARRIGHGQADLDDLVQESLIAVYLRRGHYDCSRPFRAWLFGIARHKMV